MLRLFLLILLLSGCASKQVRLNKQLELKLIPPQEISQPLIAHQLVTIKRGSQQDSFQTIVKNDHKTFEVNAVSPILGLIAKASFDGQEFRFSRKTDKVPRRLAQQILAEVMITMTPKNALNRYISKNVRIDDMPRQRTLSSDNETLYKISYSSNNPWDSDIRIENMYGRYFVTIKSLKLEAAQRNE